MILKTILRDFSTEVFSGAATLFSGFLSFAGMFVIASSYVLLCGLAFFGAICYEGQVNSKAITLAFLNIFGKKHLRRGIVRLFLEQLIADRNGKAGHSIFLTDYIIQKQIVKDLNLIEHPDLATYLRRKQEKRTLKQMELCFLRQLERVASSQRTSVLTKVERDVNTLFTSEQAQQLLTEMNRKQWLTRLSWLISLAGGVSTGLAGFSAINMSVPALITAFNSAGGILSFVATLLSAIPGSAFIVIAIIATIGVTLLLHYGIADAILNFKMKWPTYFNREDGETNTHYYIKCLLKGAGLVIVLGVGLFSAICTAGTWWISTNEGGVLLNLGNRLANWIRNITVPITAAAFYIFYGRSASVSVAALYQGKYIDLLSNYYYAVRNAWNNESLLRFFNPFRLALKIIDYTSASLLFLVHLISMGVMSDRLGSVPTLICAFFSGLAEAFSDSAYLLSDEAGNNQKSKVLRAVLYPVKLVVRFLSVFAAGYDCLFSWNWQTSWNKMKMDDPQTTVVVKADEQQPKAKTISSAWRKQEVIETLIGIRERLGRESEKGKAAQAIRQLMTVKDNLDDDKEFSEERRVLARNRNCLWQQQEARSVVELDAAYAKWMKR